MLSLSVSSRATTPRITDVAANAMPDNSRQKIYWSFNWPTKGDDRVIQNDAPNGTGNGLLAVGDTTTSIGDGALKLGAGQQIEGKINTLDMRSSGVTLSLWSADQKVLPTVRLTQVVNDVLTGESDETGTNFQTMGFDAVAISQTGDRLDFVLTRPNASAGDGSNDGKAACKSYTVELGTALHNGKGWHHVAVLWDGELSDDVDNLVVIIDGLSFAAIPSGTGTTSVEGTAPSEGDDYYENNEVQIPASRLILSSPGPTGSTAIDEVRLIHGVVPAELIRALGASRQTSGWPLIVWNGGSVEPYANTSPIPGPLSDGLGAVTQGSVTQESGAFGLDGSGSLHSAPADLFIDDSLAVASWFKPTTSVGSEPLFEVDLGSVATVGTLVFRDQQGLVVTRDAGNEQIAITLYASSIDRHEVDTAEELVAALNAVLKNTIPNQTFKIVITADITLTAPLPSLLGPRFTASASALTLAEGTQLTLESEGATPKSISGGKAFQILVIDADGAVINLKNLELRDGKVVGSPSQGAGGGGLGAGGALFIAGGEVNIAAVRFVNNSAKGGTGNTAGSFGKGGDKSGVAAMSGGGYSGTDGGAGGGPNPQGDTLYYATISALPDIVAGAGGAGGTGSYDGSGEGTAHRGQPGQPGGFGQGGGQGGGGQGGTSDGEDENGGGGGDGGAGGFGAGGGGGGGGGGTPTEYTISGGAGGQSGAHGGVAFDGVTTPKQTPTGSGGGWGASGAALGGAIFVADASTLTAGSAPPRVNIYGSCTFTGNSVTRDGDSAGALGAAIFFESGLYCYNNSGDSDLPFPKEGIGDVGTPRLHRPSSITYLYTAHGFTNDWHHVAVSFATGDVPRAYLDGIPLGRADNQSAIEVNEGRGFAPSAEAVARWGSATEMPTCFVGQVSGFKLFDRALSRSEVFEEASAAALQRVIIQLDVSTDARDGADYLYEIASPVYFNTTWIKLVKGQAPELVKDHAGRSWPNVKAALGEGLVLELVGVGNGSTAGYTADTTLSDYTADALRDALRGALPGGISAADVFIAARGLSKPDGFTETDLAIEGECDPNDEPATFRFGSALLNANLTDSVNFGPLVRINTAADQVELSQVTSQWALYEAINEANPVLLDYVYHDASIVSMVFTGLAIAGVKGKFNVMRQYAPLDKSLEVRVPTFRQHDFDVTTEDAGGKLGKGSSASDKARSSSADKHNIFKRTKASGLKLFVKPKEFLSGGAQVVKRRVKLATPRVVGRALGAGTSLLDSLDVYAGSRDTLFSDGQNSRYKRSARQSAKYGLKVYSLPVLGGLKSIWSATKLFKTGNPYDIVKGSLMLVSGLILPLVETTMVLVAQLGICAAAGPAAPIVAAVIIVINVLIIVADLIRKGVERHKMTQKAADFAAKGFIKLISDLKSNAGEIEDLYVSGRFSSTQSDEHPTTKDVLTGVTSWLYRALRSSCDSEAEMTALLGNLKDEDKQRAVADFIQALLQGNLASEVPGSIQSEFARIYNTWTSGDADVKPVVDIDLVSDATINFTGKNLVECLQQFVGERLDDGGTQEDATAIFTAGEALALDGTNIATYPRNIGVYGVDSDAIREEIQTGNGEDTVMLGAGEFRVVMGEGNKTIYLSSAAFKDNADAYDLRKYYLDAGDIADANIGTQLQRDSDTVIIDGAAHVCLTLFPPERKLNWHDKYNDNKSKQAIYFLGGTSVVPLLVLGIENVYGSPGDDTLISNAQKCTTLTANGGNNILATGFGAASASGALNLINQLKGGPGDDKLYGSHAGGQGYNLLSGGSGGSNILIADQGVNVLQCSSGSDVLVAAIHRDNPTDNIFMMGFGSGSHRIEKGLNPFKVTFTTSANGSYTTGILFEYVTDEKYLYDGVVLDSSGKVKDILQFGEGVFADNIRVSVGKDPQDRYEPNGTTLITNEVTFSLVIDGTSVYDALIGDDLARPNLQTGDSITIKGNWSGDGNYNHRLRMLRFGDGSHLEIANVETWESGTVYADTVVLAGATFFQGFAGDDTITSDGGGNVILPGSGHTTLLVNGADDQVMITRNPLRRDTITIGASGSLCLVLDGSIRLRDVGFAVSGSDMTLTIGSGGNQRGAAQTVTVNGAQGKLLLRFAAGFTLDLRSFVPGEVLQGGNDDATLTASGPAILAGGLGHDTLVGGPVGPSVFIGGAGDDILMGSADNSGDLFIIEDRGGMEVLYGAGDPDTITIDTVRNKTVLLVSTNPDIAAAEALSRDDIWFATRATLNDLPADYPRDKLPKQLQELQDGELLVWIRGQSNGVVIKDWGKWENNTNRLVITNPYLGAFEITPSSVGTLITIMNEYLDVEEKTYSPWHPNLGDEAQTLALNARLSNAIADRWWRRGKGTVFSPGAP